MDDCLENISKRIKEKHGDFEFANTEETVNFKTGKRNVRLPSLQYRTYVIKKDGTQSNKTKIHRIVYNYCPFCGIKYEKEL